MQTGFKLDVARTFFDREHVLMTMSDATYRALSKAGAFIRQTARGLIRKRKKSSLPGRPPAGHDQEFLKNNIFFGFDEGAQTLVAGPAKLNMRRAGNIPEILEKGGTGTVFPYGGRRATAGKARKVRIEARPYMQPSLDKNLPKLGGVYADSIRV